MRRTIILLLIFVSITALSAVDSDTTIVFHINSGGNIVVEQPNELNERLNFGKLAEEDDSSEQSEQRVVTVGYRVEIFADNNPRNAKSQALARRRNVSARFPKYDSYMIFESPYWRVRVGDFRSRSEAESAMAEIRRAFPAYTHDLRIVRSKIKNIKGLL